MVTEILRLCRVSVRRDRQAILAELDWTVVAGERWVVLGPNGAGKSTLLGVSATTLFPSTGSVRFMGAELGEVDARQLRARIGVTSAWLAGRLEPGQTACDVVLGGRSGALAPWWDQAHGSRPGTCRGPAREPRGRRPRRPHLRHALDR